MKLSLIKQYEFLFNGEPVAYLTGEEFKNNNRLYVHEVTLKEKLLANSNPSNEAEQAQGEILKILQKIVSAKLNICKYTIKI